MCLRDPLAGVGGMNHFLLPEGAGAGTDAGRRYGAYAMELLINDLLKAGGRRERLEAKLFGGGRMFDRSARRRPRQRRLRRTLPARRRIFAWWAAVCAATAGGACTTGPSVGRALQRAVTDIGRAQAHAPVAPPAETGALELF